MNRETVDALTIHRIVAGSRLYGFAMPESDVDLRGVCLTPVESLLGLHRFQQYQEQGDTDVCIYELRRFCDLALGANPNILDILMAPPTRWEMHTCYWGRIYDIRHAFLSQKIRYTFSGYAVSQLKRIKGHRKWLTNPPDHQPAQEEFGGEWDGESSYVFPRINDEKAYRGALKTWNQYQTWLENRNPKRAELERKYGYDVKHAKHLVRLMLSAVHILEDCDYNPVLASSDLKTVVAVGNGEWDYDYLIFWAEGMDKQIHDMPTELPKKPDFNLVESTVIGIYRDYLEGLVYEKSLNALCMDGEVVYPKQREVKVALLDGGVTRISY